MSVLYWRIHNGCGGGMKTLVGIRPSGRMHIGHYASVIKPALDYHDVEILIARYHADTEEHIPYTEKILNSFGVSFKVQGVDIDLYFKLLRASPAHLLNAMPQYKTKEKTAHMYTYPVLMAHDLVGYDRVIVGEDQRPHVEFANVLFKRLDMPRIEALYVGGKILSLRDSTKKMSSSEPETCLFLDDTDYEQKITKAVTDEAGRKNLENIFELLGGSNTPEYNQELKQAIIQLFKLVEVV